MKLADQMLTDFDFNAWKELAGKHPDDFERCREELINELIAGANERQQLMLRRLQFRIDAERYRSRTPLKSCLRISTLMWDSFLELRTNLNDFTVAVPSASQRGVNKCAASTSTSAIIIPFKRRQ